MPITKRQQAFELYSQGKRPSDPDLKALGLKNKVLYNYFQQFKKDGNIAKPTISGSASKPGAVTASKTGLSDAVSVFVSPKTFSMSSVLLWQAREAAIREWGWDPTITPDDFLDTFLYVAFKQRGIILGGYQVFEQEGGNGSKGS